MEIHEKKPSIISNFHNRWSNKLHFWLWSTQATLPAETSRYILINYKTLIWKVSYSIRRKKNKWQYQNCFINQREISHVIICAWLSCNLLQVQTMLPNANLYKLMGANFIDSRSKYTCDTAQCSFLATGLVHLHSPYHCANVFSQETTRKTSDFF